MPKILTDPKANMFTQVERLLNRGGYSAVTVRAVAQGCGVGVGTVYNYFSSKEALLAAYLLEDWRACVASIEAEEACAQGPEPVASCIYRQLVQYAGSHMAVFGDAAARDSFAGSFSQYHGLLRSQLAKPLRRFFPSQFAAEFAAEALLTWSMAGKEFCEIWGLISPIVNMKTKE